MHRNYMINDRITGYHYQSSLKKHAYMGTVDRNYTPWFQMSAIFTSLTDHDLLWATPCRYGHPESPRQLLEADLPTKPLC